MIVNLFFVKIFVEIEYWLVMIKIIVIIVFIILGLLFLFVLFGDYIVVGFLNLIEYGGFFLYGGIGLIVVMFVVIYFYGGIEIIGVMFVEIKNLEKVVLKVV